MLKNRFSLLPAIFTLAWPTILEQILQTAVQYIDTMMVGSLGTDATAAVGSTVTINWLINGTVAAIGVGFLSFISQANGAGEKEKISAASGQAIFCTLVIGVFFTTLTLALSPFVPTIMMVDPAIKDITAKYFFVLYSPMLFRTATIVFGALLRAVGDTKTPMRVGLFVNIINVVLNFILIYPTREITLFSKNIKVYGADLGVIGAAIASAVAFVVGGLAITVALFHQPDLNPKGKKITPDREILRPCLRVAIPNALQRFGTSLGYVVFSSMVNSLGEVSTAAHTVANTVESAFYIPGYGMQSAAAVLFGNAYGAKDIKRMKNLGRTMIIIEVLLMILSGAVLFVFSEKLVCLFSTDATVINLSTIILRMVACSEPFFGIAVIIEGMMQGIGKTVNPLVFSISTMWGVRILATFFCINFFDGGLISAWGAMLLHNIVLCALFVIYYKLMLKKPTCSWLFFYSITFLFSETSISAYLAWDIGPGCPREPNIFDKKGNRVHHNQSVHSYSKYNAVPVTFSSSAEPVQKSGTPFSVILPTRPCIKILSVILDNSICFNSINITTYKFLIIITRKKIFSNIFLAKNKRLI